MKQVQKAEEISNIAFGFMASKALFVALHCNLFSLLSNKSLSSNDLADLVQVPENRISTICTALTSIGLLSRKDGMYRNSIGAEKYLVKGAKYDFGDYLRLQIDRQMYGFMQQLEGVVTNNINNDYIDSYAKWMNNVMTYRRPHGFICQELPRLTLQQIAYGHILRALETAVIEGYRRGFKEE